MKKFTFVLFVLLALVACTATPTPTPTLIPSPTTSPLIPTPTQSPLEPPPPEAQGRAHSGESVKPLDQKPEVKMSISTLLSAAVLLSMLANRIVELLVTPFFTRYKWDKFALMPTAWVFGGLLTVLSNINFFVGIPGITMHPAVGLILSGVVAGGGANLLHELFGALGQGKIAKRA